MRLRFALLAAAGSLAAAGAAAAAVQVSGNAQGVALARREAAAYRAVRAETVHETGYVVMNALLGAVSVFDWRWGTGVVPPGWVRGTEDGVVALRDGRVLWWRDELTPPVCRSGLCDQQPVEVVVDRAGAFYAYGDPARHTCFGRLTGETPVSYRSLWNVPHGRYTAPDYRGDTVRLSFSYPWGSRQTAHETDTLSRATLLDRGGVIRVSGGGQRPFTIRFTNTQLARAPAAPRVNLCRG
ncbi:MAG TPA: hypothetical protein VKV27_04650 [Solirubrobacteraceae bacterium]|nr:hypothetical protein [Solirubrobacteraceae bacterium]